MSKMLLPDASLRSPTAVAGRSDMRDENVYSAVVMQHGGAGNQTLFTVPRGQTIPRLAGAGITVPTSPHQITYTELTTNITQSGQLGAAIGDAAVRDISITAETAYYVSATGAPNTYGATQQEMQELLAKVFFQFRVAGKLQNQGPAWNYPAAGAAFGNVSSTAPTVTVGNLNNGWPGSRRRLKLPILIARTDTVEATVGVAGGDALVHSVTTGVGQPYLAWVSLATSVKGDAR